MVDLVQAFTAVEVARAKLAKTQEKVKKHEEDLRGAINKMLEPIRPICVQAIGEYNKLGGYIIDPESMKLSVSLKDSSLSMFVRMRYKGGSEPDEDFGWNDPDEKRIKEKFGLIINPLFEKNSLPLQFGGFSFPHTYYMK